MLISEDKNSSCTQIDRSKIVRTQTPHVFLLKDIERIFNSANEKGLKNCVALCSMCVDLNIEIYLYAGSEINFKITTPVDVEIFRSLIKEDHHE